MLKPGFKLWRGVGGGYSPYHVGPNSMGETLPGQPSAEFWQSAQVKSHATRGYRMAVREYEVMMPTPAAHSLCSENWGYGWGGAEQYFVPEEYENHLAPTGREFQLT
jgi:hypothetical protein